MVTYTGHQTTERQRPVPNLKTNKSQKKVLVTHRSATDGEVHQAHHKERDAVHHGHHRERDAAPLDLHREARGVAVYLSHLHAGTRSAVHPAHHRENRGAHLGPHRGIRSAVCHRLR